MECKGKEVIVPKYLEDMLKVLEDMTYDSDQITETTSSAKFMHYRKLFYDCRQECFHYIFDL